MTLTTRLGLVWGLSFLSLAAFASPPEKTAMPEAAIDHVIVGIANLDEGIRLLTELTGVTPDRGGQHPGRGTQNALLSLGPRTYLELIAPVSGPPPGMELLSKLQQLTPIGWAVGTTDLDATKGRLEAAGFEVTAPRDGSRVRPDSTVLRWRTAGLEDVPGELTPFLIEWSAETAHPAATSPGGCTLESMEIVGPRIEKLDQLVAALRLSAAVRSGSAPELSLKLACPKGKILLSSAKQP